MRKVIKPIPTGSTSEERNERSHLLARFWPSDEVAGGKMRADHVYEISDAAAAYLVARKGFKYVGTDGKPTAETVTLPPSPPRPGQEGWLGEELARRLEGVKADEPVAPVAHRRTTTTGTE